MLISLIYCSPPHTVGSSSESSRASSAPAFLALMPSPVRHSSARGVWPTRPIWHIPQLSLPGHHPASLRAVHVSGHSGCRGGLTSVIPSSGFSHQDVDVFPDKSGRGPCVECPGGCGLRDNQ